MEHIVVTIARGFGAGGCEIATRLADRLGIRSYANRVLALVPQYSNRNEHNFIEVDERLRDGYLRQQLMSSQKRLTPLPRTNPLESDDRLFEFQKKIIQELTRTESHVIVGKYADYVLQDFDNVLSVYIEARRVFCVGHAMRTMNASKSKTHSLIAKTDKYRAEYCKYYTGDNYWTDPVNYDITLNSGQWNIDQCVDLIVQALQIKFGDDCKKAFPFT